METKVIISIGSILVFVNGILTFFVIRMVHGYDEQIKKLFERTSELRDELSDTKNKITEACTNIEWLKKELKKD